MTEWLFRIRPVQTGNWLGFRIFRYRLKQDFTYRYRVDIYYLISTLALLIINGSEIDAIDFHINFILYMYSQLRFSKHIGLLSV